MHERYRQTSACCAGSSHDESLIAVVVRTHLYEQLRVGRIRERGIRARDADCDSAQEVADSARETAPEEGVTRVVVARGVERLERGRGDELGGEDDRGDDAAVFGWSSFCEEIVVPEVSWWSGGIMVKEERVGRTRFRRPGFSAMDEVERKRVSISTLREAVGFLFTSQKMML